MTRKEWDDEFEDLDQAADRWERDLLDSLGNAIDTEDPCLILLRDLATWCPFVPWWIGERIDRRRRRQQRRIRRPLVRTALQLHFLAELDRLLGDD